MNTARCSECAKRNIPFDGMSIQCEFCGDIFCFGHANPQNHNCSERIKAQFPLTKDFCERLDMCLIKDITQESETSPIYPIYAIGWQQELSAGIYGGSFSPYFKSKEELEEWCKTPEATELVSKEEANF